MPAPAPATAAAPAPTVANNPPAPTATPLAHQVTAQKPAANPFFSSDPDDQSPRLIKIRGRFDDDCVHISGNKLWIDHLDFDKPTELAINGMHWTPVWNGKKSNEFEFNPAIAAFGDSKIVVRKELGRSLLGAVTMPSAANKETLSIKIVDQPVGTDVYEITVHW